MTSRQVALTSVELGPFFEDRHRELAVQLEDVAAALAREDGPNSDQEGASVSAGEGAASLAHALGARHQLYAFLVPEMWGGARVGRADDPAHVDVRSLVLIREALGFSCPLADAIFAVQGLGSYPIALAGSDAQRRRYLPEVLSGERIAAFALTEPEAGSDVASISTVARRDGDGWVIDGDKTLISNVPIADHYVVFANADPDAGKKGITAFLVDARADGLELEPQPMSIDHPIGALRLHGVKLDADALLGEVGGGFRIALATLEAFRISVGAAACGMASAALDEALSHVRLRRQFGVPLAEQQLVQATIADMATELDAARLLVARAAWVKDVRGGRTPVEAAMAKLHATEAAQRIIDSAVQLHGGRGVLRTSRVEQLYREIRPLRIYEGTSEIQKLVIARGLLAERGRGERHSRPPPSGARR
jgi:acyl-CoA dehydrogenase